MAGDERDGEAADLPRLEPLEARTLVDQVVDAIVEATATGVYLPGDRVVEAEVARALKVSRVPVREALRILEAQGIVVNERYRGMRLMDVSSARVGRILRVRTALECLAAEEAMARLAQDPALIRPLEAQLGQLHAAVTAGDSYGVARLDTGFHRCLCELSGNDVLLNTWEPLARQLVIIVGLSTLQKEIGLIAEEHDEVLEALKSGDPARAQAVLRVHILDYNHALDYEGMVAERRARRDTRRARARSEAREETRDKAQDRARA